MRTDTTTGSSTELTAPGLSPGVNHLEDPLFDATFTPGGTPAGRQAACLLGDINQLRHTHK